MTNPIHAGRLAAYRKQLAEKGFAAGLVPTGDPHLCEYVPAHWRQREALSGFTGSAGTLLVTEHAAALSTDSRYWEQAQKELPEHIELIRDKGNSLQRFAAWFAERVPHGGTVAVDEEMISYRDATALSTALETHGLRLHATSIDWTSIWPERPACLNSQIMEMRRPCRTRHEKLASVRAKLKEAGAHVLYIASLDDIAWLTNLRGTDVPNNPVFEADMLVGLEHTAIYAARSRFPEEVIEHLRSDGIEIRPEASLIEDLHNAAKVGRVMVDPSAATIKLLAGINAGDLIFDTPSYPTILKSRKSTAELEAITEAHVLDATALVEFYAELDERLSNGERLTEWDAVELLHAQRSKIPGFIDESFSTIAAYGANAAMPHYQPRASEAAELHSGNLLLIDSGAHYDCGTTDVTRMTAVGEISSAMRADATLATRAMLRLLNLQFPEGTTGAQVDTAARMDLWAAGIDFGHGTGHGVGYVLNVHEAPVRISPKAYQFEFAIGNVVSNEPGIYRPGRWGIRVENLMYVKAARETEFGRFLRFEPLTFCPIDVRTLTLPFGELVDTLNAFNARCVQALQGRLTARAQNWLRVAAMPVK